jgi:hypothetical protein
MVKEHTLGMMEESMLGNSRMGNIMVKGHTFGLMEENMLGNIRMGKGGME